MEFREGARPHHFWLDLGTAAQLTGGDIVPARDLSGGGRSASTFFRSLRRVINDSLESATWVVKWGNGMMTAIIILSVLALCLETVDGPAHHDGRSDTTPMEPYMPSAYEFWLLDLIFAAVFSTEILVRLGMSDAWFYRANTGAGGQAAPYFRDPFNWIDIVSVTPSIVTIFLDTGVIEGTLSLFMLLRTFRIFKILRHFSGAAMLFEALFNSLEPMYLPMFLFVVLTTLIGAALVFIEPCYNFETCEFQDVFNAAYFAMVSMTTVGFGDKVPQEKLSRGLALFVLVFGALYLSMPIAIIGAEFHKTYARHQEMDPRIAQQASSDADLHHRMTTKSISLNLVNKVSAMNDLSKRLSVTDVVERPSRPLPKHDQELHILRGLAVHAADTHRSSRAAVPFERFLVYETYSRVADHLGTLADAFAEKMVASDFIWALSVCGSCVELMEQLIVPFGPFDETESANVMIGTQVQSSSILFQTCTDRRMLLYKLASDSSTGDSDTTAKASTLRKRALSTARATSVVLVSPETSPDVTKRAAGGSRSTPALTAPTFPSAQYPSPPLRSKVGRMGSPDEHGEEAAWSPQLVSQEGALLAAGKIPPQALCTSRSAVSSRRAERRASWLAERHSPILRTPFQNRAKRIGKLKRAMRKSLVHSTALGNHDAQMIEDVHLANHSEDCRDRVWLALEIPESSAVANRIYVSLLVCILGSFLVFCMQTVPEFTRYGEKTAKCQEVVRLYCANKDDPLLDPGCFSWEGHPAPAKLEYFCDAPHCYGQGTNFGASLGPYVSQTCSSLKEGTTPGYGPGKSADQVDVRPFQQQTDLAKIVRGASFKSGASEVFDICYRPECNDEQKHYVDLTGFWIYPETIFAVVFSVEILARTWSARSIKRHFTDPMFAVDVACIVPYYYEVLNHFMFNRNDRGYIDFTVGPSDDRVLMFMKLTKVLRIFKLLRHFTAADVLYETFLCCWKRLLLPLFLLVMISVLAGSLLFYVETSGSGYECFLGSGCTHDEDGTVYDGLSSETFSKYPNGTRIWVDYYGNEALLQNALDGIWLVLVTMTSVGFGRIYPVTFVGKFLTVLVMIFGSFYMAMPIAIVGTVFSDSYRSMQQQRGTVERLVRYIEQEEGYLTASHVVAASKRNDFPFLDKHGREIVKKYLECQVHLQGAHEALENTTDFLSEDDVRLSTKRLARMREVLLRATLHHAKLAGLLRSVDRAYHTKDQVDTDRRAFDIDGSRRVKMRPAATPDSPR